jgi:hypothetical protein
LIEAQVIMHHHCQRSPWRLPHVFAAAAVALTLVAVPAQTPAQVPADAFSLEGNLNAVDVGERTLSVMGIVVEVPLDALVATPAGPIAFADLLGPALPGRPDAGFLNGTAKVDGIIDGHRFLASTAIIEPAENLLLGAVSDVADSSVSILGVEARLIDDARMPAVAVNSMGFDVLVGTADVGAFAAAQGYFGDDGIFHAYHIEVDGQLSGPANQTNVWFATCDGGGDFSMRGASTTSGDTLFIYDHDRDALLGSVVLIADEDLPPFSRYRFDAQLDACPANVRVENTNGSSALAAVSGAGVPLAAGVGLPSTRPGSLELLPSHPNPFNPSTTVSFRIDRPAWVEVGIYDLAGRRVALLADEHLTPGLHERTWRGQDAGRAAASGVYFVKIRAGAEVQTGKILLLK